MIDLQVLDTFAKQHLLFDARCSRALSKECSLDSTSDADVVSGLHRIRTLIMNGCVDEAVGVSEKLCPCTLQDPHVQLNVRVHKLVELIHASELVPKHMKSRYEQATNAALGYSQELAAFALDAFPEAYGIFTKAMTYFAFPGDATAAEVIAQRRAKLADDLVSLTRMTLGARESCMAFLVRYLLLIYVQYKTPVIRNDGECYPIDTMISELLSCAESHVEKPSIITWKTDGGRPDKYGHRGDYKEADIQVLPERVNISRQEAIQSLRFTDGDVFQALRNELGQVSWDHQKFRQMVIEYCAARGLDVFDTSTMITVTSKTTQSSRLSEDFDGIVLPKDMLSTSSLAMFDSMRRIRALAANGDQEDIPATLLQIQDILPSDSPRLKFQIGQGHFVHHFCRNEVGLALEICERKLGLLAQGWKEGLPLLTKALTLLVFAEDVHSIPEIRPYMRAKRKGDNCASQCDEDSMRSVAVGDTKNVEKADACEGCEVGAGSKTGVDNESTSLEDVLVDAFRSVSESSSLDAIVREAYNVLEAKHEEPQLVQLLKVLVAAHKDWETHNMMTDDYSYVFGIDEVCGRGQKNESVLDGSAFKVSDKCGASGPREGDTQSSQQERETTGMSTDLREQTILTLMEFLAMSRAEALTVVRNHPHATNPQAVLDSLLGSMT